MTKLSFETPEFLKLVNDAGFREEFSKQTSVEGLKNLFSSHNVNMTDGDLVEFAKSIKMAHSNVLDDEFLEKVAGGKQLSEALGDFVDKHPYLTLFGVTSIVASLCSVPIGMIQACKD